MKKTIVLAAMFFLILPLGTSQTSANNGNEFARWSELQSGQVGYMDTVFKGTTIERIEVRYIGTTPHPASKKERAIVIELTDPSIPKDSAAVAGTSGSPVYFEVRGKLRLVGAAAFMFNNFPKNGTIMGVTPIEAMISGAATETPVAKLPLTIADKQFGLLKIRWLPIRFDKKTAPVSSTQEGQSASRRPDPGDSVTVIFPDGSGAICTITYVRGDNFWACGHSILSDAEASDWRKVAFASYRTQITMTLFSASMSFKLFDRNLELFGTIVEDNSFSIHGKTPK